MGFPPHTKRKKEAKVGCIIIICEPINSNGIDISGTINSENQVESYVFHILNSKSQSIK